VHLTRSNHDDDRDNNDSHRSSDHDNGTSPGSDHDTSHVAPCDCSSTDVPASHSGSGHCVFSDDE
jgi:hypothetical protein